MLTKEVTEHISKLEATIELAAHDLGEALKQHDWLRVEWLKLRLESEVVKCSMRTQELASQVE